MLTGLIASGTQHVRKISHAHNLLKADDGWTDQKISKDLNVSVPTIFTEGVWCRIQVDDLVKKLNDVQRGDLTSRQFVRYGLMRIKIVQEIMHVKRQGNPSHRFRRGGAGAFA